MKKQDKQFMDGSEVLEFIVEACEHYDKSAPQLVEWLDELYRAIGNDCLKVTVYELLQLQQLFMNGEWEHPNYAQNRWYKVRDLTGKETGVVSF